MCTEIALKQAAALQDELLNEYSKDEFQQRLHSASNNAHPEGRPSTCQTVCCQINEELIARHVCEGLHLDAHNLLQDLSATLGFDERQLEKHSWLLWLSDPSLQAILPDGPPAAQSASTINNPGRRSHIVLSEHECLTMQDEELVKFRSKAWQQKLHDAWTASGDNPQNQRKLRDALCLEVQIPIVSRFGFEASQRGVLDSMLAVTDELRASNPAIAERSAWLRWLTDPRRQRESPLGPPTQTSAADLQHVLASARLLLEEDRSISPAQIPDWRTLAQVPRTVAVRVVGALSAELLCAFELDRSNRVIDLKCKICRSTNIAVQEQHLILGNRALCDAEVLGGVVDGFFAQHEEELGEDDETCDLVDVGLMRLEPVHAQLLDDLRRGCAMPWEVQAVANNRDFMLAAVRQDGSILRHAASWISSDHEVVLAAMESDGKALQFAGAELREDKSVVLAAVRSVGSALKFASVALRADVEVLLAALAEDTAAVCFIAAERMSDADFSLVVRASGVCWNQLPISLQSRALKVLKLDGPFFVVGSWDRWTTFEELERMSHADAAYMAHVEVKSGLGRVEFQIVRDCDWSQRFHPGPRGIVGPDAKKGKSFEVDLPYGCIGLEIYWDPRGARSVEWKICLDHAAQGSRRGSSECHGPFFIIGSWDHWKNFMELQRRPGADATYMACVEFTSEIERAEFQIVRNRDWDQRFHPGPHGILGPDSKHGNNFEVDLPEGCVGLEIHWDPRGACSVDWKFHLSHTAQGENNLHGPFFVIGSWDDWKEFIEMEPNSDADATYMAHVEVKSGLGHAEFQIVRDHDCSQRSHPGRRGIVGPNSKKVKSFEVNLPDGCLGLGIYWDPRGAGSVEWNFCLDHAAQGSRGGSSECHGPFFIIGSWDHWKKFTELRLRPDADATYMACVKITSEIERAEFQIVRSRDWDKRYHPGPHGILGPDSNHGSNFEVDLPEACVGLEIHWDPRGARSVDWKFHLGHEAQGENDLNGPFFVIGSWDDWKEFIEMRPVSLGVYKAHKGCVLLPNHCTRVEFQIVCKRDWTQRFHPGPQGIAGPDDEHGVNWNIDVPLCCTKLDIYWDARGERSVTWEFLFA